MSCAIGCDYFARVKFCPFSLPLGVRGWLRFVIVALPGLLLTFLNIIILQFSM